MKNKTETMAGKDNRSIFVCHALDEYMPPRSSMDCKGMQVRILPFPENFKEVMVGDSSPT